ncbi:hypothetical protein [Phenylobacterium sp.]|jgi:hypothetical protein|uniref:hypothetical protein n=1 Tax=Phenylobacterium sp. TaxID=1871053 RepID=UPI002F409007
MRTLTLALILAAAGSAARAQGAYVFQRAGEVDAELAAARQRDVALHNELMALDARLRAEQALRDTDPSRGAAPVRLLPPVKGAPPRHYASVPDDRLAASNARVKAAAENRR